MNADALLTLARGFMPCRILLTAAELDLFSRLADGPRTAAEVAAQLRADLRAVTILLDALAALELIAKRDDRYSCPPEHARLLAADSPHTVLPMIQHCASLWRRWTELTGVVRGDPAARARAQAPRDDAGLAAFIGAMHVLGRGPAAEAVALIDPGAARSLLDVGGGSGIYTQAFLEASPHLRGTLFDRPAVIELARARLEAAGLLDRVTLAAGDFEQTEVLGTPLRLLRVEARFKLPDGQVINSTLWLDRGGETLKTASSDLGQETYRATREIGRASCRERV